MVLSPQALSGLAQHQTLLLPIAGIGRVKVAKHRLILPLLLKSFTLSHHLRFHLRTTPSLSDASFSACRGARGEAD
uniref:Uncharacterized protein n=1 Tax=Arundo donax TaxID=35708 RepID=A0A0A9HKR9_ARUDO